MFLSREKENEWSMGERLKNTHKVCFITRLFYGLLNKQVVGRLKVSEFSQCLSLSLFQLYEFNGPEMADITDDSFIT